MKNKIKVLRHNIWMKMCILQGMVGYMFHPFIVIGFIGFLMIITCIIAILIMLSAIGVAYDTTLAIMTGVLSSGILAIIMEMANNYSVISFRF